MPRSDASYTETSVHSFNTEDTATTEERRRPKKYKWHKRFAYQKFKGWRPILNPHSTELFFVACGVLLIALGVPILVASLNVVELRVPYAFEGPFAGQDAEQRQQQLWQAGDDGVEHSVSVLVEDRMEPPIWVAFELGTFFQNFRRYARSYDPARMHDGAESGGPASACEPFSYVNGDKSLPINPCGQIAHSFFNDTFRLFAGGPPDAGGELLQLDDSDIAWSSDAKHLYGDVPAINYNDVPEQRGGNTSSVGLNQNQHWMVWMRPGAKVAVQKLYAKLDTPIEAGTNLTIVINNRYNTYAFNGAKTVIISTNSWVGGNNIFLGACYLTAGGLCLLTALFFFVSYDLGWFGKRSYGELVNLSWLKKHAVELGAQHTFPASNGANGSGGGSPCSIQLAQQEGIADSTAGAAEAAAHNSSQSKN